MKINVNKFIESSLFQTAGVYTIASIVNSAIPFFLLPILTRYLTESDYGIVSMFGVMVNFIGPFIGLSVIGSIGRIYYEQETIDLKVYIANCMYILFASTGIICALFLILGNWISSIMLIPYELIWFGVAVSMMNFITSTVLILLQLKVQPVKYGLFQVIQTTINAGLSVILVVIYAFSWKGRIIAQFLSLVVATSIASCMLFKNKWLKFEFNMEYTKKALRFGIPLIPHTLGAVIMTMTDRLFITKMVGIEATGVYSVGFQIGMIINILTVAFNQAYSPWLFARLKENLYEVKVKIVKLTYVYFGIVLLMAGSLSLIAPWFLSFFVGERFGGSSIFVLWIALGYAFNGMYFMVTNYIFYVQKTSILAKITFFSACLNVLLNYFFIRLFGAIGAAQATSVIYFIQFLLTWIMSARVYKMPWKAVLVRQNIANR